MCALLLTGAVVAALMAGQPASARERGAELRCSVAGGFGFFVAGRRAINCVFYRPDDKVEFYIGSSDKFGVDLGPANATRLAFRVAGLDLERTGELQGNFVGAEAGASIGFGLSGEGLIGGQGSHIMLVPLYNQGLTGLNITAGLGVLELHYAGSEPRALHERY